MHAVIRIRGSIGLRKEIKDSFKILKITRKNHCIILPENKMTKGMLQKTKDWITWGQINDDVLKKMIIKRGRKPGNKRLTSQEADEAFNLIKQGKKTKIKPVFRLTPPSKGFKKSIKQHYPRGELGNRKEKINDLILRMI